ncbi:MAG: hypothetical protein DRH26_13190 [Deltaproteobacteria bacterium]|nr:MAG: hypothetical protein DRH26_13190 [Deltaproteobacteria bacterium]
MATDTEILATIDLAIIDILENGQEVVVKGTTYTKANLSSLFDFREKFSQKASTSSDTFFSRSKIIIPRRGV